MSPLNQQIMLLRLSPYNEDFILDGYATNDEELIRVARNRILDFWYHPVELVDDIEIIIDHDKKVVKVLVEDDSLDFYGQEFYITYIPPVSD